MNINKVVSLVVIAMTAIAFFLTQLIPQYQEHAVLLGAASASLTLIANKLPAAFEMRRDPGAIELPPEKGGAQ